MQRSLEVLQRTLLYALLVPIIFIVVNAILRGVHAQRSNPIVGAIDRVADAFTFESFETMFARQSYVQTALVALAVYGVLMVVVVLVFRLLRALAASASRPGASKKS